MKANSVGQYFKENMLREEYLFNSGDPLETITPSLDHVDGCSFVVVVETAERDIAVVAPAAVVAGTGTWTFPGASFGQGDVGGTFTVAGATNGGNNGAKVILTVVDATHVTTATTSLVNETFDPDDVTVSLVALDLAAEITIDASNDYAHANELRLNQIPSAGHWADITDGFSPAPDSISGEGNQYFQAYPLVARRCKLTITPSAGAAYISIFYSAKGNR